MTGMGEREYAGISKGWPHGRPFNFFSKNEYVR